MSGETLQGFDLSLQQDRVDTKPAIEPAFEKDGVPYFTEMPAPPEAKPRQTILSLDEPGVREFVEASYEAQNADDGKNRQLGWAVGENKIENPRFGSFDHGVVVEFDDDGNLTRALHDTVTWSDGPIDERTGLPTSGSVVIPVEKVVRDGQEEYYVHAFWQYRPAAYDDEKVQVPAGMTDPAQIRDFIALNRGENYATTGGGFAGFVGETAEAVAKRETLEEQGLRVGSPKFVRRNFNRANVVNPLNVGYATFERAPGTELPNEGEKILGKMAVRIDQFETTDAIVESAVNFARKDLGLIAASPRAPQK